MNITHVGFPQFLAHGFSEKKKGKMSLRSVFLPSPFIFWCSEKISSISLLHPRSDAYTPFQSLFNNDKIILCAANGSLQLPPFPPPPKKKIRYKRKTKHYCWQTCTLWHQSSHTQRRERQRAQDRKKTVPPHPRAADGPPKFLSTILKSHVVSECLQLRLRMHEAAPNTRELPRPLSGPWTLGPL